MLWLSIIGMPSQYREMLQIEKLLKENVKMGKFILKISMLLFLLLFGVILGMQLANQNMKKMQGYDDPKMYEAFTIDQQDDGDINATVLGNQVSTTDLEEKKKEMEEWKAFNVLSSAGKGISDTLTGLFKGMAGMISDE
jgi:hypothetical protein